MDSTAAVPPLPQAELRQITKDISLLAPLTRQGHGPGLIIILPSETPSYARGAICHDGQLPPLLKWAEEGFAVVQIIESAIHSASHVSDVFEQALHALQECSQCHVENGVGLVSK